MKKKTPSRIGVMLTAEDRKIMDDLQKKFGGIGPTAVIRMALRSFVEAK